MSKKNLKKCIDTLPYEKKIRESTSAAKKLGVWGTPSFFINQSGPIFGNLDYKRFKILIDNALETSLNEQ